MAAGRCSSATASTMHKDQLSCMRRSKPKQHLSDTLSLPGSAKGLVRTVEAGSSCFFICLSATGELAAAHNKLSSLSEALCVCLCVSSCTTDKTKHKRRKQLTLSTDTHVVIIWCGQFADVVWRPFGSSECARKQLCWQFDRRWGCCTDLAEDLGILPRDAKVSIDVCAPGHMYCCRYELDLNRDRHDVRSRSHTEAPPVVSGISFSDQDKSRRRTFPGGTLKSMETEIRIRNVIPWNRVVCLDRSRYRRIDTEPSTHCSVQHCFLSSPVASLDAQHCFAQQTLVLSRAPSLMSVLPPV